MGASSRDDRHPALAPALSDVGGDLNEAWSSEVTALQATDSAFRKPAQIIK